MAKGKNHDRKANPDFGKTKSKSKNTDKKPEFNMKRVKGGSQPSVSWSKVIELMVSCRREFLPLLPKLLRIRVGKSSSSLDESCLIENGLVSCCRPPGEIDHS